MGLIVLMMGFLLTAVTATVAGECDPKILVDLRARDEEVTSPRGMSSRLRLEPSGKELEVWSQIERERRIQLSGFPLKLSRFNWNIDEFYTFEIKDATQLVIEILNDGFIASTSFQARPHIRAAALRTNNLHAHSTHLSGKARDFLERGLLTVQLDGGTIEHPKDGGHSYDLYSVKYLVNLHREISTYFDYRGILRERGIALRQKTWMAADGATELVVAQSLFTKRFIEGADSNFFNIRAEAQASILENWSKEDIAAAALAMARAQAPELPPEAHLEPIVTLETNRYVVDLHFWNGKTARKVGFMTVDVYRRISPEPRSIDMAQIEIELLPDANVPQTVIEAFSESLQAKYKGIPSKTPKYLQAIEAPSL